MNRYGKESGKPASSARFPNFGASHLIHLGHFHQAYIYSLKRNLYHIQQLKINSTKTTGVTNFQKALFPTSDSINLLWWKKPQEPKSLIPDLYITKPAVKVANLRFEGMGDIDGLDELGEFGKIEARSSPRGANTLFRYDYYINSPDGIAAKDLNAGIYDAITTLFSHSGKNPALRVQHIEIQVSHTFQPIKSFAGSWGILTTRTLWTERTMGQRIREHPWYIATLKAWKRLRYSWPFYVIVAVPVIVFWTVVVVHHLIDMAFDEVIRPALVDLKNSRFVRRTYRWCGIRW
ncbi:hypothetical protein TWF506_009357 [Arthrobotrys conoides]|uniref:Uncharacterized protein n=1 Tax=Arthrobotrys conoides TaxID=74498 RepID=A0AAN8RM95_9PEZI